MQECCDADLGARLLVILEFLSSFIAMFAGAKIVVEVPFEYGQRDQLLQLMESKFPGAEISVVHAEVNKPQVSETFVEHDSPAHRANTEPGDRSQDATTIMQEATDTLSKFTKPSESWKVDQADSGWEAARPKR